MNIGSHYDPRPELSEITDIPALFYIVTTNLTEAGVRILPYLEEKCSIPCTRFSNQCQLIDYRTTNHVPNWRTIPIRTSSLKDRCLNYECLVSSHIRCSGAVVFSITVNTLLATESEFRRAANQIASDFCTHYMARIKAGLYPWGSPPKIRRRRSTEEIRARRNYNRSLKENEVALA